MTTTRNPSSKPQPVKVITHANGDTFTLFWSETQGRYTAIEGE